MSIEVVEGRGGRFGIVYKSLSGCARVCLCMDRGGEVRIMLIGWSIFDAEVRGGELGVEGRRGGKEGLREGWDCRYM